MGLLDKMQNAQLTFEFQISNAFFFFFSISKQHVGFPGGSDGKESTCNAGDPGSVPGLGRSPGGGNGNPLQYSCLENSMDRRAWLATVHGVMTEGLTLKVS